MVSMRNAFLALLATSAGWLFIAVPQASADLDWETALVGEHREANNISRNDARHPRETLEFFGLKPGMTVVEVYPGGGWYTEVLAPLLRGNGKLVAVHYGPNESTYRRRSLGRFLQKLAEAPEIYGEVEVAVPLPPRLVKPVAPGSADLVLTFRNVHSGMRAGRGQEMFNDMYDMTKPGGVLGVVQHRGKPGMDLQTMKDTAYITEEQVIEFAELAGFDLEASSEVNANPKDTKDYPEGVWSLPPSLDEGETNRERYLAIGESDRMTLRFRKPME